MRALRRMKLVATGAFVLMAVIFGISLPHGRETLVGFLRWDHITAFAEAAMIGALADWFAVVALFRHPLGLPIWHTAIIPRKKDEIGRNVAGFVETRLLSVENLEREIQRLSAANTAAGWLETEENRERLAGWATDALATLVHQFDDEEMQRVLGEVITRRLHELDAASLLSGGLRLVVDDRRHEQLIDVGLRQLAGWLPSRRETVREFVERAINRALKWGSRLVPNAVVEKATDQTLGALIDVIEQAAADPHHPLRADLNRQVVDWIARLEEDELWRARIEEWKGDIVGSPRIRGWIASLWDEGKLRLIDDLQSGNSTVRSYARKIIDSFYARLQNDQEFRTMIDERLRSAVKTLLARHHGEIGALVQRVIDSWDGNRLSREMELALGKDLQYIRLNGTFIGGIVGLIIHLFK